jgi:hypothetical protein
MESCPNIVTKDLKPTVLKISDAQDRVAALTSRGRYLHPGVVAFIDVTQRMATQIREEPDRDTISIVLIIDARGKSQAVTLSMVTAAIERKVQEKTELRQLKLAGIIDTVVSSGTGAIPAIALAMGNVDMDALAMSVTSMPTQARGPASPEPGCCGIFSSKNVIEAIAHNGRGVDRTDTDAASSKYDRIKMNELGIGILAEIFGPYTNEDLVTGCEVLGAPNRGSLLQQVVNSSQLADVRTDRENRDARREMLKAAITNAVATGARLTAEISTIGDKESRLDELSEQLAEAEDVAQQLSVDSANDDETAALQYYDDVEQPEARRDTATPVEVRNMIADEPATTRNTLVITLTARTYSGPVYAQSYTSQVIPTRNEKYIATINYSFNLPLRFMKRKKGEGDVWQKIQACINDMFADDGRNSSIQVITRAFTDLLALEGIRAYRNAIAHHDDDEPAPQ